MRNFFPSSSPILFDKMFGKGARQIQASPSDNLEGCCCNCKSVQCKGCIEGHVIKPNAGCCHTPRSGLIFEYERPASYGNGMQCNHTCGQKVCCPTGKESASNVKFYYNYIGQYFRIDYNAIGKRNNAWPYNGRPRLCSYCDPTSSDINRRDDGFPFADETCLDRKYTPSPDARYDDRVEGNSNGQNFGDYPCSNSDLAGPVVDEISLFKGCQCMGNGALKDPNDFAKRLSKYRKRQMERDPYYRWLLDIMCYDGGNVIASPYYSYDLLEGIPSKITNTNGGTLYDHLIGVVHCEHWYEIARCPNGENPQHDNSPGILGDWILDGNGNPVGANLQLLAPRFWVYACSGAPLFDFEIEDAANRLIDGQPLINQEDQNELTRNFANQTTPPQRLMDKLASGGYFDVGDWRNEALNEIRILKGLSFTMEAYGGTTLGNPDLGACCHGKTETLPPTCIETTEDDCRDLNGTFNPLAKCTSELCVNCSGFKPESGLAKYLGPVRKRLWIPTDDGGINYAGITRAAWLDPLKARKNTPNSLMDVPNLAKLEKNISNDNTLVNLQLPDDLIKDPWGGSYPAEPIGDDEITQEYKDFVTWRESQWLYMHARPGGWDYVCSGYASDDIPPDEGGYRIPNLPRRFNNFGEALGGCLDGLKGWPRKTIQYSSGCEDIDCGEEQAGLPPYPVVGCDGCGVGIGVACQPESTCPYHPEHKGGLTPCEGIAYESNCDGIRWVYYSTKVVQPTVELGDYHTCKETINSYLYRVNIDAGNYGSFCPHVCRSLEIPKSIANAIPSVFSNRQAHKVICERHRAHNLAVLQGDPNPPPPYVGNICPGLFCRENVGITPVLYNAEFEPFGNSCCLEEEAGPVVNAPIPTNPAHPAADRRDCPLTAGPPCFTPTCELYDGRFVGTLANWNPKGCCWECSGDSQNSPVEYKGIITYEDCKAINQNEQGIWDGRGFLYLPDQLNSASSCINFDVGLCACGTNNPAWEFGSINCSPRETEGE